MTLKGAEQIYGVKWLSNLAAKEYLYDQQKNTTEYLTLGTNKEAAFTLILSPSGFPEVASWPLL